MEIKITGIQAAGKRNFKTFSELRPTGVVRLIPEPDNEYDKYAVRVDYRDTQIGYLPAQKSGETGKYIGSDIQKHVVENNITTAMIKKYCYVDGDDFNNEHRGLLGSVTLSVDVEDMSSGGRAFGARYQRVTSFISYFDPYGGGDGLINWAFDNGNTFEEYKEALNKTAEDGAAMHDAIESCLKGEVYDKDLMPKGWDAFVKKYEPDLCYAEQRFFDNTLMVTGQPDFVGYINGELAVVDWKSSKKPSIKHALQVSIYAKNAQWNGEEPSAAYVVAFGAENKQGFSVTRIDKEKIESNYIGMRLLRQCMDACGVWISKYWEGE